MHTDEWLMGRVKAGELRRLAVLFERYHRPLFKYCFAITRQSDRAEDCVQETFHRILQYRQSYGSGHFRSWLFRIARNAALDFRSVSLPQEHPEPEEEMPGPEDCAVTGEARAEVQSALMRLKPIHREVIVLAKFQELSAAEVGQIIGIEEGTVRVRLHRALKALADQLSDRQAEKT